MATTESQELPGPTEPLLRWSGVLLALVGTGLLVTWLARRRRKAEARE